MLVRVCLATAIVSAGCDDGIATSEISANLVARFDESELEVEVSLSPDYVVSAGESLYITFRGARIGLQPLRYPEGTYESLFEKYGATTAVDSVVQADETLTMTLERADGEVVEVTAAVPPPFMVTAPETSPAAQGVTVTWTPTSSDAMAWRGNYGCAYAPWDGPIREDMGSLTFPADLFELCGSAELSLSIDRTRTVIEADTRFEYARAQIVQTQHAVVELTP